MKKVLAFLSVFGISTTVSSAGSAFISANNIDDNIELYTFSENKKVLLISVQKSSILKYTLTACEDSYATKLVVYFKNGTIDDFNNKKWFGSHKLYKDEFTKIIGFPPEELLSKK